MVDMSMNQHYGPPAQHQNGYQYSPEYPSYTPTPQGGTTETYGPPAYQQHQPAPTPFLPAAIQPAPVVSSSQRRRKWLRATQGAVTRPVLRAAPPGQDWILVPAQPSGNETPQTKCLEYNSTAGASEAQPLQPGPEQLSVPQPQPPVLPPLIPKPRDTEPEIGIDTSMENDRTPRLQIDGSDKLYVEETLARMEQAAKES